MTRAVFGLFLLVCPAFAWANLMTMTFDSTMGIPMGNAPPYQENGISAAGRVAWWTEPGTAYVAQGAASPFGGPFDFTTGGLFVPVSVMIDPLRSGYCAAECGTSGPDEVIEYIWISGFLNDALMGEIGFFKPGSASWFELSLGLLGTIDRLRIQSKYVGLDQPISQVCFAAGCGTFNIDTLRVESVPEPEMLGLLVLGGLAAYVSRRRRAKPEQARR